MSAMICIDAGPLIRLVAFPDQGNMPALWAELMETNARILAPALLFYEVTNVLHRYRKHRILSGPLVEDAIAFALTLPISLVDDAALHRAAAAIAGRLDMEAAYDAHYLALAERTGAAFWTIDKRLSRQARQIGIQEIRLIE